MSINNQLDEIIDFKQFFFKIVKNWYFFVLSLLLTFTIAFAYNRYTHELYEIETTILINADNTIGNPSDLLYEKAMQTQHMSLENKELILKSYPLIYSTLAELKFDIAYEIVGNIKVSETYIAPFKVECNNTALLKGKSVTIEYLNQNNFRLIDKLEKDKTYHFGEEINFYNAKIRIDLDAKYSSVITEYPKTVITFRDLKSLTQIYQNKIVITQKDKESTVIHISILEEDPLKGVVFLNKLTENYIVNELNDKNLSSKNTVSFINKQLEEMSDSLSLIEQQIQEYKNKNQITDLSLKAQTIYTNIVSIETELAKSKRLKNYYNYLENYIDRGNELESISVPTSFSINDVSLNVLIDQLVEIQIKKNILVDGGQINNPAIAQYNRKTKQLLLKFQLPKFNNLATIYYEKIASI